LELHERIRRLHALRHATLMSAISPTTSLTTSSTTPSTTPSTTSPTATPDALRLDARARAVVQGDRRVLLTRHEFLLLECLLRAQDTATTRADITRYAWPDKDDINPASVNLVISRLRKKLDAGRFDVWIETVAGVGYRLAAAPATPTRR
jgi:DNA-binding response OmpR family regulator